MYIITILTVNTNDVEIINVYNEELEAQNHYLDKVTELSSSSDENICYESIFVSKVKANIYKKVLGWIKNGKDLHKIVTLHYIADYDIMDR